MIKNRAWFFWFLPGFLLILFFKLITSHRYVQASHVPLQFLPLLTGLAGTFLIPGRMLDLLERFSLFVRRHCKMLPFIFFPVVVMTLLWVNRHVLLQFSNSADEHSCYFLAQCFLKGKLWAESNPVKEFFTTPHLGDKAGKWFSVFPPGWPLLWALAIKLGLKDAINPILGAGAMFIFFKLGFEVYGVLRTCLAAILLFISPFFLMNAAAYYSHSLCLFIVMAFFLSCLRWRQEGKLRWAVCSGLLLGYGYATRYLTMAAVSIAPLAYLAREILEKRFRPGWGLWLFGLCFLVLIAAHLEYNFLVTGSFFDIPVHYLHAHEKLGFIAGYTPGDALEYLEYRIFYLMDWTPPFLVMLFFVGLLAQRPEGAWDFVFRISAVSLPIAYLFYYSWGGGQYGPRYYFEAYPFMIFAVVSPLSQLWKSAQQRLRKALWGMMLGMILGTLPIIFTHFSFYQHATSERKVLYDWVETKTQKPALVFLKGALGDKLVLSHEDSIRNHPFFEGGIVYAADLGSENNKLFQHFPNFHYYGAHYDREMHRPALEELHA